MASLMASIRTAFVVAMDVSIKLSAAGNFIYQLHKSCLF